MQISPYHTPPILLLILLFVFVSVESATFDSVNSLRLADSEGGVYQYQFKINTLESIHLEFHLPSKDFQFILSQSKTSPIQTNIFPDRTTGLFYLKLQILNAPKDLVFTVEINYIYSNSITVVPSSLTIAVLRDQQWKLFAAESAVNIPAHILSQSFRSSELTSLAVTQLVVAGGWLHPPPEPTIIIPQPEDTVPQPPPPPAIPSPSPPPPPPVPEPTIIIDDPEPVDPHKQLDTSVPVVKGGSNNNFIFDLGNGEVFQIGIIGPNRDFSFSLSRSKTNPITDAVYPHATCYLIDFFTFTIEDDSVTPVFTAKFSYTYQELDDVVNPDSLHFLYHYNQKWNYFQLNSNYNPATKTITQLVMSTSEMKTSTSYFALVGTLLVSDSPVPRTEISDILAKPSGSPIQQSSIPSSRSNSENPEQLESNSTGLAKISFVVLIVFTVLVIAFIK
jgi:hypothetical protein